MRGYVDVFFCGGYLELGRPPHRTASPPSKWSSQTPTHRNPPRHPKKYKNHTATSNPNPHSHPHTPHTNQNTTTQHPPKKQKQTQELALFNPKLAEKPQVVVLNKIDLPHVAAQQAALEEKLKAVVPHTRFMAVSAMQKTNTAELMHRVGGFSFWFWGVGIGCVCFVI